MPDEATAALEHATHALLARCRALRDESQAFAVAFMAFIRAIGEHATLRDAGQAPELTEVQRLAIRQSFEQSTATVMSMAEIFQTFHELTKGEV